MKKFRFQLEPLMRLRKWEEVEAKKKLAMRISNVEKRKQELSNLESERFGLQEDEFSISRRIQLLDYWHLMNQKIFQAQKQLQQSQQFADKEMKNVLQAMRRRKVLEKLEERKFKQHKKEVLRMEGRFLDELGTKSKRYQ